MLGEFVGQVQQPGQGIGDLHIAAGPGDLRQTVQRCVELRAQQFQVDIGLSEQGPHRAAFLIEERRQDMRRFDELMIPADRQTLGVTQGLLKLVRQFVHTHG